jgi:uncharacterized protein YggE
MSMKIKPIHLASAAVAVLFVSLSVMATLHGSMGGYGPNQTPRYVNVIGDGTVKVTPDSVRVDASISSVAASSAASLAATAKSADSMRASLKGSGVEAKYIKALNLSTNPEYSYPNNGPAKLTGYRSTQSFSIVIRDAKNAGMIIQSAQSAVGNSLSINSTSPYVFDQKIAEANARTLAIASAKAKAQSYAELTGSKLGKVLSIDEQITQSNPMPLMAVAKTMDASAAPVRVDLGQQDITINVTTKWELK